VLFWIDIILLSGISRALMEILFFVFNFPSEFGNSRAVEGYQDTSVNFTGLL
jgi:hypothetical protein